MAARECYITMMDNLITPKANTLVPPKPMNGAFVRINSSLLIPICWNAR